MTEKSIEYLLGIDGGGTKTEFLLTDISGAEIKRLVLGASNPVNVNIENTYSILRDGITVVCKDMDFGKISVFAGIAGAKAGNNLKLLNSFLGSFGFGFYCAGSDVDIALRAALKDEDGTVIISGTGIAGFSRVGQKLFRSGGRGYLIDKGGSGFHFGSDVLNAAFEYVDGRGTSDTILMLTEKRIGKNIESVMSEVYSGGPAYIASFAPVVFEAFLLGDASASEIINRNVKEIARIINALHDTAGTKAERTVICGGLCNYKDIIHPVLMKYINFDSFVTYLEEPVVNGAVALARKHTEE